MKEQRTHHNWSLELNRIAKRGDVVAQKIIAEAVSPGEYFDGPTHFYDLIHAVKELKKDPGVQAIGIFGSRRRKEHVVLESDVDILVINDTPIIYDWSPSQGSTASRKTYRYAGIAKGINIQECTSAYWYQAIRNPESINEIALNVFKSVRWFWVKNGYDLKKI